MKVRKIIFAFIVTFYALLSAQIYAQVSKLSPVLISKDKTAIFKEGETVIADVKFRGLDSDYENYEEAVGNRLPETDVVRLLRENRASIIAGEKFDSRKIGKVIILLKQWLADKSYWDAEVVALGEKLPKNQMNLVFSIKRNLTSRVSEIRFAGNKIFTNEELIAVMNECLGDSRSDFDRKHYDFCAQKEVRSYMFSRGYFQARLVYSSVRFAAGNFILTFSVNEGIRYRWGKIKIEGATVFSRKEILELFGQDEGDVANGKFLQDFVYEKLKKLYGDKGYILYNAEFNPELTKLQAEGLDGIANVSIVIDQGKQFKIANINFIGVDAEKGQKLKELLGLKEGEIYNQTKVENEVKKINETEEFYPIDFNKYVELTTDEEKGEVSINIKLRKIE